LPAQEVLQVSLSCIPQDRIPKIANWNSKILQSRIPKIAKQNSIVPQNKNTEDCKIKNPNYAK
jgi:hypothetical protein